MISNSKTTLELDQLLSCTITKIARYGKLIQTIIIRPSIEKYFGKTYFSLQLEFKLDEDLIIGKITQDHYDKMQNYIWENSISRTHIQCNLNYIDNHFEQIIEIREIEAKYQLFLCTLRSFINFNTDLYGFKSLELDKQFNLESEIDALKSFPMLKFRNEVIQDFFFERDGVLTKDALSYTAYAKKIQLLEMKKKQEDEELKKHLESRQLIANVGDYCLVINEYLQPLNLMEITAIANSKAYSYFGYEVKTDLKTGKRPVYATNQKIACVFTKEYFISVSKSLLKIKSKEAFIKHLTALKDDRQVKYLNKKLCKVKLSAATKSQFVES